MFDRGLLFVGAGGIGLGVLAEALALDCLRKEAGPMPLRVYSATMNASAQTDPVLLRALQRLKLEARGLSLKPLALYAFAGAPRIDHVIMLGAELPAATRLALGDMVDVRRWRIDGPAVTTEVNAQPGPRYLDFLRFAELLKPKVKALITELTHKDGLARQTIANSA